MEHACSPIDSSLIQYYRWSENMTSRIYSRWQQAWQLQLAPHGEGSSRLQTVYQQLMRASMATLQRLMWRECATCSVPSRTGVPSLQLHVSGTMGAMCWNFAMLVKNILLASLHSSRSLHQASRN